MSKIKELATKVAAQIVEIAASDSKLELLAEMAEEIIDFERKQMPTKFGYTRERALIGRCRWACDGHLPAAILVHHVLYRFGKKGASGLVEYKGRNWICQSREWWCYELALTRHEYDGGLRIAKNRELIDVAHAKISAHGLPTTLIRPTEKALLLRISMIASVQDAVAQKKEAVCSDSAP